MLENAEQSESEKNTPSREEDYAHIHRLARRRLLVAAFVGVLVLILGFFAGRNAAEHRRSEEGFPVPIHAVSFEIFDGAEHPCECGESSIEAKDVPGELNLQRDLGRVTA